MTANEEFDKAYSIFIKSGQSSKHISDVEFYAAQSVRDWIVAHDMQSIPVDDENETPSYARIPDVEDEDLDDAVAWLPRAVISNPTKPAWNPVVTLADLNAWLDGARGSRI
jgi:hypothetical protein